MDRRKISNPEYLISYAKYLTSGMTIGNFCREQGIDYLEFCDFINNREKRLGEKVVEGCMENLSMAPPRLAGEPHKAQSPAQRMFSEIIPVPDHDCCRSVKRFPENPAFRAELDLPMPDSILKPARITFPSGACIELQEASLKTLILTVVLYEDFDTWFGEQSQILPLPDAGKHEQGN